jgi:hypothetical protein
MFHYDFGLVLVEVDDDKLVLFFAVLGDEGNLRPTNSGMFNISVIVVSSKNSYVVHYQEGLGIISKLHNHKVSYRDQKLDRVIPS